MHGAPTSHLGRGAGRGRGRREGGGMRPIARAVREGGKEGEPSCRPGCRRRPRWPLPMPQTGLQTAFRNNHGFVRYQCLLLGVLVGKRSTLVLPSPEITTSPRTRQTDALYNLRRLVPYIRSALLGRDLHALSTDISSARRRTALTDSLRQFPSEAAAAHHSSSFRTVRARHASVAIRTASHEMRSPW